MAFSFKNNHKRINGGKKPPPGFPVLFLWILISILFLPAPALFSTGKSNLHYTSITFKKVLEINETEDNDFYFKSPDKIEADGDENIYVLDINRILKFSKTGSFVKNMVKIGQGPSEVNNISNFYLVEKAIIIHNNYPSKIIWMDINGKLLKEFRINKMDHMDFIQYFNDTYFFYRTEFPEVQSSGKFMDIDRLLTAVSADGKEVSKVCNFPVKGYFVRIGGDSGSLSIDAYLNFGISGGRYLFVSHTSEYKIKCFDLKEGKVIKEFGVAYERKKIPDEMKDLYKGGMLMIKDKTFRRPQQIYFSDIEKLLIHNQHLWVVTSTVDKVKGRRVDIYNFNGDYLHTFYMVLEGQTNLYSCQYFIAGQYLYIIDISEEDEPVVFKYKIVESEN